MRPVGLTGETWVSLWGPAPATGEPGLRFVSICQTKTTKEEASHSSPTLTAVDIEFPYRHSRGCIRQAHPQTPGPRTHAHST